MQVVGLCCVGRSLSIIEIAANADADADAEREATSLLYRQVINPMTRNLIPMKQMPGNHVQHAVIPFCRQLMGTMFRDAIRPQLGKVVLCRYLGTAMHRDIKTRTVLPIGLVAACRNLPH